jgi:signal transduction histidine kinase
MALGPSMRRLPREELRGIHPFESQPRSRSEIELDASGSRQAALLLLRLLIHEISQPITTLIGEIELALLIPRGEKELKATFERCLRSLESVRSLVTDFRLAGEMNETAIVKLPLVGLINRVVETERRAAQLRGCRINWHAPTEAYITSDPEVLAACLTKVLAKIVNACPTGKAIDVKLARGTDVTMLEFSYPMPERDGAHSPATVEKDSDWMLAARMIQLLGGSLRVRHDEYSGSETCVDITLFHRSAGQWSGIDRVRL